MPNQDNRQNDPIMEFTIQTEVKSIIRVIGVGGAGGNAVSNMYESGIVGVDFAICNTDNQDLENSPVPTKIQLGPILTNGLGAGNLPQKGKAACNESIEDIRKYLQDNTKMLFLTAGMGGGTGTGATPIIAKVAQELGILTIGIVTLPFSFEGPMRMRQAAEGLDELRKSVDALIVISNDKLRETYGNMGMKEALRHADEVLCTSAKGIAEIITLNGDINIDFNDVDTVMRKSGVAILGTGVASGPDRAQKAVEQVLNAPLLADNDIQGAKNVLINIISGSTPATLDEITQINNYVQTEAGFGTNVIWGNVTDDSLGDEISVTVIATGFDAGGSSTVEQGSDVIVVDLDGEVSMGSSAMEPAVAKMPRTVGLDDKPQKLEVQMPTTRVDLTVEKNPFGEPYVKPGHVENESDEDRKERLRAALRKTKESTHVERKISSPEELAELETVPAYERKNVQLDDVQLGGDEILSNLTLLGQDDDFEIISENSFLHKKVD